MRNRTGTRDLAAAVLLLGGAAFVAYGCFVLLPAKLSALGIAFTTESMVGLGASSPVPLAAMAGGAADRGRHGRSSPGGAGPSHGGRHGLVYAPIAIWFGLTGKSGACSPSGNPHRCAADVVPARRHAPSAKARCTSIRTHI